MQQKQNGRVRRTRLAKEHRDIADLFGTEFTDISWAFSFSDESRRSSQAFRYLAI